VNNCKRYIGYTGCLHSFKLGCTPLLTFCFVRYISSGIFQENFRFPVTADRYSTIGLKSYTLNV